MSGAKKKRYGNRFYATISYHPKIADMSFLPYVQALRRFNSKRSPMFRTEEPEKDLDVVGIRNLIAAVIHAALKDVQSSNEKAREKALEWLYDEENEAGEPFTFAWCCRNLSTNGDEQCLKTNVLILAEQILKGERELPNSSLLKRA